MGPEAELDPVKKIVKTAAVAKKPDSDVIVIMLSAHCSLLTNTQHSWLVKMKPNSVFLLSVFMTLVTAQTEEKTNVTFVEGKIL